MGLRECIFVASLGIRVIEQLRSCRLRLQMYKGMGFEPVADKEGRLSKMLVRA
jgi:hypothetical protein